MNKPWFDKGWTYSTGPFNNLRYQAFSWRGVAPFRAPMFHDQSRVSCLTSTPRAGILRFFHSKRKDPAESPHPWLVWGRFVLVGTTGTCGSRKQKIPNQGIDNLGGQVWAALPFQHFLCETSHQETSPLQFSQVHLEEQNLAHGQFPSTPLRPSRTGPEA